MAKDFRPCQELRMDLKTDDGFVTHRWEFLAIKSKLWTH